MSEWKYQPMLFERHDDFKDYDATFLMIDDDFEKLGLINEGDIQFVESDVVTVCFNNGNEGDIFEQECLDMIEIINDTKIAMKMQS